METMNAPRRFKTGFIFFSSTRHKELKEQLALEGKTEKTTTIAKMVSKEWREMAAADREFWEEKSRNDKARYEAEMITYNENRKSCKRGKKDPDAPKRPMSAFLAFSNQRRAALKREHPNATNSDLSKMLSKSWKEASAEFKAAFVEEEAKLRAKYKSDIVIWRKKKSEEMKASASSNAVKQVAQNESLESATNEHSIHNTPVEHQRTSTNTTALAGVTGAFMQQLNGYGPPGGFAARTGAVGGLSAELLGALHGAGRYANIGDSAFFNGSAFSAEKLLNQGAASQQFAQLSTTRPIVQEGNLFAGLGQLDVQGQQNLLGQALAAQGLQLSQSIHPSLQALVGNPFINQNLGNQSLPDVSNITQGNWFSANFGADIKRNNNS